jgi:hypothetical protein
LLLDHKRLLNFTLFFKAFHSWDVFIHSIDEQRLLRLQLHWRILRKDLVVLRDVGWLYQVVLMLLQRWVTRVGVLQRKFSFGHFPFNRRPLTILDDDVCDLFVRLIFISDWLLVLNSQQRCLWNWLIVNIIHYIFVQVSPRSLIFNCFGPMVIKWLSIQLNLINFTMHCVVHVHNFEALFALIGVLRIIWL